MEIKKKTLIKDNKKLCQKIIVQIQSAHKHNQ